MSVKIQMSSYCKIVLIFQANEYNFRQTVPIYASYGLPHDVHVHVPHIYFCNISVQGIDEVVFL